MQYRFFTVFGGDAVTLIVICAVCVFVGGVVWTLRPKTTVIKQKCNGDNVTQIAVVWDD